MIKNKKVLILGPSKLALENFDYSIVDNYDFIARTNKLLQCNLKNNEGRCDLLFINSSVVRFYLKHGTGDLENRFVFVKRKQEKQLLLKANNKLNVIDIEEAWLEHYKMFYPHQPYYGTLAISYLLSENNHVSVAGFDFYTSGFSNKESYISGYYDLVDLKEEEPIHKIKKDILFLHNLSRSYDIKFIHKTKTIFEEITSEL